MKRTATDNARFHMLVTKNKLEKADKAELVQRVTNGRATSSKDLTHSECMAAIKILDPATPAQKRTRYDPHDPCNMMRRKVLSYMHELDYETAEGKIDMPRVDAWCEKFGKFKKKLNAHNHDELVALVSQVETMYRNEISK